jgi:hypothetical protein
MEMKQACCRRAGVWTGCRRQGKGGGCSYNDDLEERGGSSYDDTNTVISVLEDNKENKMLNSCWNLK